jgi:hypothetical protein
MWENMIKVHYTCVWKDSNETHIKLVAELEKEDLGNKNNRGGEYDQSILYEYMEIL